MARASTDRPRENHKGTVGCVKLVDVSVIISKLPCIKLDTDESQRALALKGPVLAVKGITKCQYN